MYCRLYEHFDSPPYTTLGSITGVEAEMTSELVQDVEEHKIHKINVTNACTITHTLEGVPYTPTRVKGIGYKVPHVQQITHVVNKSVHARYKTKQKELGGNSVWVWHATDPHITESICLFGFQNRKNLGKLFGDGIYTSSFLDTALYYALQHYPPFMSFPDKVHVKLILSRAVIGKCERVDMFLPDVPMLVDTHLVYHTDGARLGVVREFSSNFFQYFAKTMTGTGLLTGEEVVVRNENQLCPCYSVTFCVHN